MFNSNNNPNVNQIDGNEAPVPAYTLFNSGSVALATILGGPVPGTILMAANYRRLGQKENARLAILGGIGAMALSILLGIMLPQIPSMPIAIGVFFGLWRTAETLQGTAVDHHVNKGGRLGSKWLAFGLGMIFLIVISSVVLLTVLNAPKGS